jgi:hypothetical protein
VPVYEDNPERPLPERSPLTPDSQYHDASSTIQSPLSPLALSYIEDHDTMRLRNISGNEQRRSPSLTSSLSSTTNKGRRRTTGTRQSSFEAAEYIDHIEKQLEQVKQAMHSPGSGKPIHDKMKTLKIENVRLKKTIEALESSFEARVKNSVEHMTAGEGELRRKARRLEDELRKRDMRIDELEYEHDQSRLDQGTLETLKATIERLEGEKQTLEDANRSIEKRNDMLTELLAFSPTKSHQGFELTSPRRSRGRLPRPVSMMSSLTRFPSSPTSKQPGRPSSMVNSPAAVSPGGYFNPHNVLELELEHPCNDANDTDSGLGESCSAKSPVTSTSRRSTLLSQASSSPSAWCLPLATSSVEGGGTIRPIQKRKPRRFMTGSTQLKPLLLPSMAAESTGLTSPRSPERQEIFEEPPSIDQAVFSYDLEGSLSSPKREVSEKSLDPTTSFLSHPFENDNLQEDDIGTADPGSSPPLVPLLDDLSFSSLDSAGLAVELEDTTYLYDGIIADIEDETGVEEDANVDAGSPERRILFSPKQFQQTPIMFTEGSPGEDIRSSPATQDRLISSIEALMHSSSPNNEPNDSSPNPRKRRRTSSNSSLSQSDVTILAPIPANPDIVPTESLSNSPPTLNPPDLDTNEPLQQQANPSGPSQPDLSLITLAGKAAHRTSRLHLASPKRSSRPSTPLEILQRRGASSSPLAAVTIRSIYGTLSRYTTYLRKFKRDPLALAKRVIANAWCSNWKRFGKLSWWVLGIFLPGGRRDYADAVGWDWEQYDSEAVADMVCRPDTPNESVVHPPLATPRCSSGKRSVRFEDQHDSYRTHGSKKAAKPVLKGGKEKQGGLGKSLYLWGKFSVAIMMAIGGAVWQGPGEMLKDCDNSSRTASSMRNRSREDLHQENPDECRVSNESPEAEQDVPRGILSNRTRSVFPNGSNFDFSKTVRSPSRVFTFGSPNDNNFWDEDEEDPERELNHCHQPDYGEELIDESGTTGFHAQHSVSN